MTTIRDVMSDELIVFPVEAPVAQVARVMRDKDIGDVIVVDNGRFVGLLTDRDIVVRAIAEGYGPDGDSSWGCDERGHRDAYP
jgi:CBS domain-containing protein